jgi:hypothetical protein
METTVHKEPIPTSYSKAILKLKRFSYNNPLRERNTTKGELHKINVPQHRITIII